MAHVNMVFLTSLDQQKHVHCLSSSLTKHNIWSTKTKKNTTGDVIFINTFLFFHVLSRVIRSPLILQTIQTVGKMGT